MIPHFYVILRCARVLALRRIQPLGEPNKIKLRAFSFGVIPPQNGENVENAIGIERQKGRAARKRVWQRS